jgi:hypothetical protein
MEIALSMTAIHAGSDVIGGGGTRTSSGNTTSNFDPKLRLPISPTMITQPKIYTL